MADNIFDIAFESGGIEYKGWVNPSDKLNEKSLPTSFHVVLNETSFGYVSRNGERWTTSEERPEALIEKVGEAIDNYYNGLQTVGDRWVAG